jgi:hypothetical protein
MEESNMPDIDDPIGQAKKHNPERGNTAIDILFDVADKFDPSPGLVNFIRRFYSDAAKERRVMALLEALESEIRRHDQTIETILHNLKSPDGFTQTLVETAEIAMRTIDIMKIKRFAAILGFSVTYGDENTDWDEVTAYIRDISQLTDQDIETLRILYTVYSQLFSGDSIDLNPNQFVDRMKYVTQATQMAGMQPDEFYSRCLRLSGFGLAIEVQKTPNVAFGHYCFRPMSRGKRLITMIQHLEK